MQSEHIIRLFIHKNFIKQNGFVMLLQQATTEMKYAYNIS